VSAFERQRRTERERAESRELWHRP